MDANSLTVLVHGHSKVGKSTFAVTSPAPRLLLDVESASRFLPIRRVMWDPMTAPPELSPDWDTAVVYVRDYETVVKVHQWLASGKHPFRSLIVDSISELQVRCMETVAGRGQMKTQQWGDVLRHMSGVLRDLRDLTMHPTNPLSAVVLTSMTRNVDGVWRPYLQGALASVVPYLFDVTGYLYVDLIEQADETTGQALQPVEVRRLLVSKHPNYEAGERVQGRLGKVVTEPNIEGMVNTIYNLGQFGTISNAPSGSVETTVSTPSTNSKKKASSTPDSSDVSNLDPVITSAN